MCGDWRCGIHSGVVELGWTCRHARRVHAQSLNCDMTDVEGDYRRDDGRDSRQDALTVTWAGTNNSEVRARYAIENGQPRVRELAARRPAGNGPCSARTCLPRFA